MKASEYISSLAAALASALDEIEKADKDKTNPHFRSKYADLGNVVDAIKPALVKNGLSFIQVCHEADNAAKVETIILHKSGEWVSCGCISVPVSKSDAQGFGSALTYARRYSLSAAFGVAPEDDDGSAAAKAAPKQEAKEPQKAHPKADNKQPQQNAKEPATQDQLAKITDIVMAIADRDNRTADEVLKEISTFPGKNGDVWLETATINQRCTKGWAGKVIAKGEELLKEPEPF